MILVTGATGLVGSSIVQEFISRKAKNVRAMIRSEKDRGKLPAGVEAVQADFADAQSLGKALAGVEAAYLVCSPVPQLVEMETNFLKAAKAARTPHVVINSALGAADFEKTFPSWHRKVEEFARASGLKITILRPNGFMQNVASYYGPTIRAQDAIYSTIGDARISLIDVRDVAAAAATALTNPTAAGKTYELSGPEAVSYAELAQRISKLAGRPIKFINLTKEQMLAGMQASGMPAEQAKNVLDLDDYYRTGKGAASDAELRQLLTRPPRKLDDYLAEIAPQLKK
jgi:uncharacterized protein YbjT (DUF2867 family)